MHPLLLTMALAAGPDLAAHDSLLLQSPAILEPGSARVGASGGGNSATGLLGAFGLWAVGSSLAAEVGASNESGKVSPTVGLRFRALSQEASGLDLAVATRFKSDGFKGDGSEVEVVASVGRTFGDLSLAANAVAGKGVSGADAGVDLEGGLAARLALGRSWWAGLEGRYRRGLESEAAALRPPGRDYDLLAGPTFGAAFRMVRIQGLVGLGMPQGTAPAGFAGIASASVDF